MVEYAILTEKPSAMKNFAKALGGTSGTFNGHSYKIVASHGHLLQWQEPEAMVSKDLSEKYKDWSLTSIPWNPADFKWAKVPSKGINPRTKKVESAKKDIDRIKAEVSSAENLVIATDVDPSGEGEMIGWEIINAIRWKKPVYRIYHVDESEKMIQVAFNGMKDISSQSKDGDYLKAEARSKWDYLSMQLTRVATVVAKDYHVNMVANQGRLKSVIVRRVYEQEQAIKNYVKKPFYEVRFKDEEGNVFKISDQSKLTVYSSEAEAAKVAKNLHTSAIGNIKETEKHQAPPKLLDLAGLSSILAPRGFSPQEVLDTYQKMYNDQIVSYPRTDDKFISEEQFNQMVPLINQIAEVVGVDKELLTHRTARKSHVKNGGSHGANRPGLKVPSSLSSLNKYGKSAAEIYDTLAKNFLAIFGEDYVYKQITANLVDYPEYETKINVPVAKNYKAIFNVKDDEEEDVSSRLGKKASPFINQGANKKPQKPTIKWINSYLEKFNVGTGATRTSTIAELTKRLLKEARGALSTTDQGKVVAVLAAGTWIADVKITEALFNSMDQVGKFKLTTNQVITSATTLVKHDKEMMIKNGAKLKELDLKNASQKDFVKKEKREIVFNGKPLKISSEWGGHAFTDDEIESLAAGNIVEFKTAKGKTVKGKLGEQTFKGHKFVGFKKEK